MGVDAEHVIRASVWVWVYFVVDFFDNAHAVLEEEDRRFWRKSVFDRGNGADHLCSFHGDNEVVNGVVA